jgi:membrane-associated phospholipid phosphatase
LAGFHGVVSVATEPAVQDQPRLTDHPLTRRLIVSAVVAALVCAAVYVLLVHTALGQRFDNAALIGSEQQVGTTKLTEESILRRITADSFAVVLGLIVLFGLVRRRPRLGIAVALAAGAAVVGTDLLRKVILTRPTLVHSDTVFPVNTFPSGHTATAISCALALVVVSPPSWRGISAIIAGSYAWFTAAAVQTAGWHRPSDAIGAAFLGFAAIVLLAAVIAAWRPVGYGNRFGHLPAFVVLGVVWLAAAAYSAINALRVLRFFADHADTLNPTPAILSDAYHFSIGLTIVVVISLLGTLLLLLGRADLDEPLPSRPRSATT